jgi:hypothetical protein
VVEDPGLSLDKPQLGQRDRAKEFQRKDKTQEVRQHCV